jgi:serine/threonine protein kinase
MERLRSGDPEQIGPWQIVNRLGSGGMGVVYMGTNGTRAAAIKVVREFLLEDPASRTRLTREVETLLRVKSDFVAEIVGSDIDGNPAWIATNYVDGPSLKILIEKEGPLTEEKWIEFARGFLSALSSVHAVGVVHRDIKPSNILLAKSGPKLIDFGISFVNDATSLTGTGMVAGTPAWLAPEQFLGREITTSVDNFAAGSTLMFAATGKTPWGADDSSVGAVMHTILVEEPDLSALTEFQIEIVTPLLVKDVQSRKTASQMLKKLNDGPKNLGMRSKKETKTLDRENENSFLDKARKQDLDQKKAKQEAEQKRLNDELLAKERQEALIAREREKELARQSKEQEKIARRVASDAAKKQKAELRAAKKLEASHSVSTTNSKKVNPKIVAGVFTAALLLIVGYSLFGKSENANISAPKVVEVVPSYNWTALISGESKTQTGEGTTFQVFVCDQNVVSSSLVVKNISTRSTKAGALAAKVLKGDARCGSNFDTIVVTGKEAAEAGSVNYYIAGKTVSGFDFRYDFSVTVLLT